MDDLFAATFPSTNNFGFINCSSKRSPVQGIIAKVPSIKGVEPGDVLTLFSQGYTSFDDKTPIPGTATQFERVIGPADVGQPVDFIIGPYATAIKPIRSGSLGVCYSVTRGGNTVSSPKSWVKISVELPGGGTCPE
ncbi:hypothetical protein [Pseudomonas frederiksbergensis]|uniref:hypothetical protein n=1 Tax=Pseudomonas frederiksbergensis TaxID=104087 RepID=UPI0011147728|nr:hypothetical protein [Pseudomonas frederiksbergensis]